MQREVGVLPYTKGLNPCLHAARTNRQRQPPSRSAPLSTPRVEQSDFRDPRSFQHFCQTVASRPLRSSADLKLTPSSATRICPSNLANAVLTDLEGSRVEGTALVKLRPAVSIRTQSGHQGRTAKCPRGCLIVSSSASVLDVQFNECFVVHRHGAAGHESGESVGISSRPPAHALPPMAKDTMPAGTHDRSFGDCSQRG